MGLHETVREIKQERAKSNKAIEAHRKRTMSQAKANAKSPAPTPPIVPITAITPMTDNAVEPTEFTETTEVPSTPVQVLPPVDPDKKVNHNLHYIGGKQEITLTRSHITLLADSKTINYNTMVLLLLLMEYGTEEVLMGDTFFNGVGELSKFSLAYNLEPDKVFRAVAALKGTKPDWSKMHLQMSLELSFKDE